MIDGTVFCSRSINGCNETLEWKFHMIFPELEENRSESRPLGCRNRRKKNGRLQVLQVGKKMVLVHVYGVVEAAGSGASGAVHPRTYVYKYICKSLVHRCLPTLYPLPRWNGRERDRDRDSVEREARRRLAVGVDRDEFVSFHAGKLSHSPRPMIYWATMW